MRDKQDGTILFAWLTPVQTHQSLGMFVPGWCWPQMTVSRFTWDNQRNQIKLECSTSALLTRHCRFMKLRRIRCQKIDYIEKKYGTPIRTSHCTGKGTSQQPANPNTCTISMTAPAKQTQFPNQPSNRHKLRKQRIFRISGSWDWKSEKESFKTQCHNTPQSNVQIRWLCQIFGPQMFDTIPSMQKREIEWENRPSVSRQKRKEAATSLRPPQQTFGQTKAQARRGYRKKLKNCKLPKTSEIGCRTMHMLWWEALNIQKQKK